MVARYGEKDTIVDRRTLNLVLAGMVLAPPAGLAATSEIKVDVAAALAPRFLGAESAPITLVEYFSLTCSACAKFHRDILPKIKEKYVDSGQLRLEFRDFPLDIWALRAAAMARGAPAKRYDALLEMLYRQQTRWTSADDILAALKQIGRLAGLSPAYVQACLKNGELLDGIANSRLQGNREFGIASTPSFLILDSKIDGYLQWPEFDALLTDAVG